MNHIRRVVAVFATLAGALLACTATLPPAFAVHVPPGGKSAPGTGLTRSVPWPKTPLVQVPAEVHTVVIGGMPGWQITLIAAGAALAAAAAAVLLNRAWELNRLGSTPGTARALWLARPWRLGRRWS
jgi:hypothetical protein